MNPLVEKYLLDKQKAQGDYADQEQKMNMGGVASSFGNALAGRSNAESDQYYAGQKKLAKENTVGKVNDDFKTQNEITQLGRDDDKYTREKGMHDENDSVSSNTSRMKQALGKQMVPGHDWSQLSGTQIDSMLPSVTQLYKIQQDKLEKSNARAEKRNGSGYGEGQKALDKDYAKDYNDWTSTGSSSLEKNLKALEEARDALASNPDLTGGFTGALGDRLTSDDVLKQRQKVGSAVQNSLKATLGSQFTEKEGERILKNAYNEAASSGTNKESLNALINQLREQGAANTAKAKHFEQNKGTLQGFTAPQSDVVSKRDPDAEKYAQMHQMPYKQALAIINSRRPNPVAGGSSGSASGTF